MDHTTLHPKGVVMDVEPDPTNRMREGFFGPRFFLSNFYENHPPLFGAYPTNEHFYQAMKSLDPLTRSAFQHASTPGWAKKQGRTLVLRPDWELVKDDIMRMGLAEKFLPGSPLARRLLDTGNEYLEETNYWHDQYWGNCTCGERPRCAGPGANMLGLLLMERRKLLRSL